jgi:hypothetical protein
MDRRRQGRPLTPTGKYAMDGRAIDRRHGQRGRAAAVVSITNPGSGSASLRRRGGSRARAMSTAPGWSRIIPRGSVCLPPSRCPRSTRARRDCARVRHAEDRWHSLFYELRGLSGSGTRIQAGHGGAESAQGRRCGASHAADCCRNLAYAPGVGPGASNTEPIRRAPSWAWPSAATPCDFRTFVSSGRTRRDSSVPGGRIEGAASGAKEALPNGFAAELKKFYYDVAGATNRGALASLLQVVAPTQIVFGTDFPPGGTSAAVAKALADVGLFSESDLRAIDRGNAVRRLLPRSFRFSFRF